MYGKMGDEIFPVSFSVPSFLLVLGQPGTLESEQKISALLSKEKNRVQRNYPHACIFLQLQLIRNFACEEFSKVIYKPNSAALCSFKASHINSFNLMGSYEFQVWDAGRNLKVNTFFFFFFNA